jgi:hypothetical protein
MTKPIKPLESARIDEATAPHRCAFRNRQGNQCRIMLPDANSEFCASHVRFAEKRKQAEASKIAAELLDHCDDLQTLQGIHNAFANLYKLFAAKKISRPDAFLLAYITRSLVRTAMILETKAEPEENDSVKFLWKNWDPPNRGPVASPGDSSGSVSAEQSNLSASEPCVDTEDSAISHPPAAAPQQPSTAPASRPQPIPSFDDLPYGAYFIRQRPPRRITPKYRGF